MNDTIQLSNVEVRYGDAVALDGITLTIRRGAPLVILGRNGAGKTTLLSTLAGLLRPHRGQLTIPHNIRVSYLPEDRGVYPTMTVTEHLTFFADLAGLKHSTVPHWLKTFELDQYATYQVQELSKGNQQRVQLACALIDDPECIILDEPLSGLDPIARHLIISVLRSYARNHWIILSAHEVEPIADMATDIAFIRHGEIVQAGSVKELYETYGKHALLADRPEALKIAIANRAGLTATTTKDGWLRVSGFTDHSDAVDFLASASTDLGQFCWSLPSMSDLYVTIIGQKGPHHV